MVSIFVKRMSFIGSKERLIVLKKKKVCFLVTAACSCLCSEARAFWGKIAYVFKRVFSDGLVDFVLGSTVLEVSSVSGGTSVSREMASWSALSDLVPLHFVFCKVC